MTNVALNKPIEEQQVKYATTVTDGTVTGYTGRNGFGMFIWPGFLTVDLEKQYTLKCIKILLWDGLEKQQYNGPEREYKYRLLASLDHKSWKVIFDSGDHGYKGWQVFDFPDGIDVRYVRIHGLFNSRNQGFQIVQVEAYDEVPPVLDGESALQRTVLSDASTEEGLSEEVGDGLSLSSTVERIINGIENLVDEKREILQPEPFEKLIAQLRVHVKDISALDRSMDSVRRRIIDPVRIELKKSTHLGRLSVGAGILGGILAIITLIQNILR